MKKITVIILTLTLATSPLPTAFAAESDKTETISYNYSYDAKNGYVKSDSKTRRMEKLDRGLVAVNTSGGVYLSWRLFDSEDTVYGSAKQEVSFNIYRDGQKIDSVLKSTNYTDTTVGKSYSVAPVIGGKEGEKCAAVSPNTFTQAGNSGYFDIPLVKPADETINEGGTEATKSFSPTDCSTGDLDGDGEYEIIVKWVSQEQDVGNGGYSGTVRFGAYKLDGTKLWDSDINLGKNVYSSAHTVQFLVYDFNGDGKAEMMCQTSLGSKDAKGRYVSHSAKSDSVVAATGKSIAEYTDDENATADFNGYDRKISGEEFLTVFNGETGEAIDTIDLPTSRGSALGVDYGDNFGNRSNRFVSDVAYLDGVKPYAVYLRGYYFGRNGRQRTSVAGISFDGERLSPDYRFDTKAGEPGYYEGAELYVGQGNHNCTVADVNNDGKDEFITGALCLGVNDSNEFKVRWCTFLEHGDALHIGDYDPTHKGLEFFTVHEDGNGLTKIPTDATDEQREYINAENAVKIAGPDGIRGTDDDYGYIQGNAQKAGKYVVCNFGMSVIDADTGDILFHKGNTKDTGRGVMANTGSGGYYQITGVGNYQCNGGTDFTSATYGAGSNFRIFWDGDLYDELLDGTGSKYCPVGISSFNGNAMERIFTTPNGYITRNDTKNTPALTADLFGDWREELVVTSSTNNSLRVYTTTIPTDYKIKTLMHDPVYRSGVAAEQTAYNQPPHVGFYMSEELFKTAPVSITATLSNSMFFEGKAFDRSKLTVTATYTDGSTEDVTELSTVTGFDNTKLGKQTVTVSYRGLTDKIEVTVIAPSLEFLNNTYETTSASQKSMQIGSFSGDFIIEHTVTINSMPADGNEDKGSTDGFFVRFNPEKGTGAGWYLTANGNDNANVYWKSGSNRNNATAIATGDKAINIGEKYTFRYAFTEVGTGNGAYVTLTVLDSSGGVVSTVSGLNLRNMSFDNQKTDPLAVVQIYNQAQSGSTASVTIANAHRCCISNVNTDEGTVTLNSPSEDTMIFAARYSDGQLEQVERLEPDVFKADTTIPVGFTPDKIFVWSRNMRPLDLWIR